MHRISMKLQVGWGGEAVTATVGQSWEGVTYGQWYVAEQCIATCLLLKDFGSVIKICTQTDIHFKVKLSASSLNVS